MTDTDIIITGCEKNCGLRVLAERVHGMNVEIKVNRLFVETGLSHINDRLDLIMSKINDISLTVKCDAEHAASTVKSDAEHAASTVKWWFVGAALFIVVAETVIQHFLK